MNTNDFPDLIKKYLDEIILDGIPYKMYGSIANNALWAKGDIDILQPLKTKNREKIYNELKEIVKYAYDNNNNKFFVSEIKFGEISEIKNEIEEFMKKDDKKGLLEYISRIKKPSTEIIKLIKAKSTPENKYKLSDALRSYYILRWDAKSIIDNKADYLLEEMNELIFKVDFQFFDGLRFKECSNYVQFLPFRESHESKEDSFLKSLGDNVRKTFYADQNYFKCCKRLYSYYKQLGDTDKMAFFEDIINNPSLSNLYLIKTELNVLETIYEFNKPNNKTYKKLFKLSIDSLKNNTIYLDETEMNKFNKIIDKLKEMEPKKAQPLIISYAKKIKELLNKQTIQILKNKGYSLKDEVKKF